MSIVDLLYRQAKVKKAEYEADNVKLEVNLNKSLLRNLLKNSGVRIIN